MKKIIKGILLPVALFYYHSTFAQQSLAFINQKAFSKHPEPSTTYEEVKIYVQTDRSTYQPGERLQFASYLLNRTKSVMEDQRALHILIIDAVKRKLVMQERFAIESGFSEGSILLPDTLNAGEYWVIAYTNTFLDYDNQPVFRKRIRIRTQLPAPFSIIHHTVTASPEKNNGIRLSYQIGTSYSGLASGGTFDYTVFAGHDSVTGGSQTIDGFGEVRIDLNRDKLTAGKIEVVATVTRNGLSSSFILPVEDPAKNGETASPDPVNQPQLSRVSVQTDSSEYHTRSKVTLHIHVSDSTGQPIGGIFSVAVAAARRSDGTGKGDITAFTMTPKPPISTRHTLWTDGNPSRERLIDRKEVSDFGYVLLDGRKPTKPVSLALLGYRYGTFDTDSSGWFALPYSALMAASGSVNYLSITDKWLDRYTIHVYSKADTINKLLAALHYPLDISKMPEEEDPRTPASEVMLKAAIVKAAIPMEYDATNGQYNSRHCDQDRVLSTVGYAPRLNPNFGHPDEKPQEGGLYFWHVPGSESGRIGGAIWVVYHCALPTVPPFMKALQPIVIERPPRSLQDSSVILGFGLQSTLCWQPLLSADHNGNATFSFYTNNLSGKFTCTLQGIDIEGAICSENSFIVRP